MKRSFWFLSSFPVQSFCLRAFFLCLTTSGCCHYDYIREPFGPGTGPSLDNCCYPDPIHGGGCVEEGCCGTECCEAGCCEPSCSPVGGYCQETCVPPATLCAVPRGHLGPFRRGMYYEGPYHHRGPLSWVFGLLGIGGCAHGGCGEMYWGDFHGDPPDVCDPCDQFGNYAGGCCGCGGDVYPPRPGFGGGCTDCDEGVGGYPMEGDEVYYEGQTGSPAPAAAPPAKQAVPARSRPSPSGGMVSPSPNAQGSRLDYQLPPGAKIISETDEVMTAAPRSTAARTSPTRAAAARR